MGTASTNYRLRYDGAFITRHEQGAFGAGPVVRDSFEVKVLLQRYGWAGDLAKAVIIAGRELAEQAAGEIEDQIAAATGHKITLEIVPATGGFPITRAARARVISIHASAAHGAARQLTKGPR